MKLQNSEYAQAVWRIAQTLQGADQLDMALADALKECMRIADAEAGSIWYHNKSGDGRIYPVSAVGGAKLDGVSIGYGEGIAGSVVKTGQPVAVFDCANDPRFNAVIDRSTGFVTRDMICLPLTTTAETIGCIQLLNKKNGRFDEGDTEAAVTLAQLAAVAIEDKGLLIRVDTGKKPIITLKNVEKSYQSGAGPVRALRGVDVTIYEGELVVILGESGCGKSTLLNIIGGMDTATTGSVIVDDKDYSKADEKELTDYRRRKLGFVFQAYNLMPNLTAKQNLDFISELVRNPMESADALAAVGLKNQMHKYPAQMSGGQQQRVSIARALVKRPKLILADEPTAALDSDTSREILKLFEDSIKDGVTTVIVTHNAEITKMANRVFHMRDGIISAITMNMKPLHAEELMR